MNFIYGFSHWFWVTKNVQAKSTPPPLTPPTQATSRRPPLFESNDCKLGKSQKSCFLIFSELCYSLYYNCAMQCQGQNDEMNYVASFLYSTSFADTNEWIKPWKCTKEGWYVYWAPQSLSTLIGQLGTEHICD